MVMLACQISFFKLCQNYHSLLVQTSILERVSLANLRSKIKSKILFLDSFQCYDLKDYLFCLIFYL